MRSLDWKSMVNIAQLIAVKKDNSRKRAQCSECPYFSRAFVPSYMAESSLVVVGEAPGNTEALEGAPFVGESGKLLRKTLLDVGFDVSKVTFTNVCRCHPPSNEQPQKKAQELCTKLYLFNELAELNPKLVVLSGSTALNAFFPKEKIMGKAGNFLHAKGMLFMPVLHPAYCLRNPTSTSRLRKDLKKAYQYINNEVTTKNNFIVVDTQKKLDEAYHDLVSNKPDMMSFDIETNEKLDVFDKDMTLWTCGFGLDGGTCYSIPMNHPENDNITFREKCLNLVGEVLLGPSKKIAHNAAFDLKVLKKLGYPCKTFYADTMVMAFLLDENRYSIGLKQLSSEYLDGYMYEFTKDLNKLCLYNNEDCNNTMLLFKKFEPEIRQHPKMWQLFEKTLMPMIEVIVDMELEGVLVDTTASSNLAHDIHRKLDAVYESIAENFPKSKGVNLGSPKQLGELMFDKLKYPIIKKTETGLLSTDNEVLESLSKKGYKLAAHLLKVRKSEKMLSTYVEKLPNLVKYDGRIHGNFNICGARTGRTSSSDPNLQNIPRDKLVKRMFIASPGCMLLQADASQAELRVACSIAPEPTMIQAYQDGHDVHTLTASKILNVLEKDVTKDQRQTAKGTNFGLVYGQTAEGLQLYIETKYGIVTSLNECRIFRDVYFKLYSGFLPWYKRVEEFLRKFGYVESPTGRRRRFPEVKTMSRIPDDILRKAVNSPVQGAASDIVLFMMVRMRKIIAKYKIPIKMILTVHDSILFDGAEDDLMATVPYEMNCICANDIPKHFDWLKVPMRFDYSIGPSWGDLKDKGQMWQK